MRSKHISHKFKFIFLNIKHNEKITYFLYIFLEHENDRFKFSYTMNGFEIINILSFKKRGMKS